MSYCRWSSMDFKCDLYCYEDAGGGWTTHVAANRVVGDVPPIEWGADDLPRTYREQMDFLSSAERAPIGLPCDGQTFSDETLEEFKTRLLMLREIGYIYPDEVLAAVDEEIAGQAREAGQ